MRYLANAEPNVSDQASSPRGKLTRFARTNLFEQPLTTNHNLPWQTLSAPKLSWYLLHLYCWSKGTHTTDHPEVPS